MKTENRIQLALEEEITNQVNINVIGIGGGGCNAVNRMIDAGVQGVHFIAANTDFQSLSLSKAPIKIQLGAKLTGGRGAGADPETGRRAALEDTDRILEQLEGAQMTFVTAGLGGGTGTGGAPIVGTLAKELGALTVAVVTKPFHFEGQWRLSQAEEGLEELKGCVDTVVTVLNDKLVGVVPPGTSMIDALKVADDVLRQTVQGTTDLINIPGQINLDFANVKNVLRNMGSARMGTGICNGKSRATDAAFEAVHHPLLEDVSIEGAKGILINITGSEDLTLQEVKDACYLIQRSADSKARIAFGSVFDQSMEKTVKVTVIAAGLDRDMEASKDAEQPSTTLDLDSSGFNDTVGKRDQGPNQENLEIPAFLRFPTRT